MELNIIKDKERVLKIQIDLFESELKKCQRENNASGAELIEEYLKDLREGL